MKTDKPKPEGTPEVVPNEIVQMLPNTPEAKWEDIPYKWMPAVNALGHAYNLRRVNPDTGEVLEERAKTPRAIEQPVTTNIGATRSNPNVEFELWWQESSGNEQTKEAERNAYLAGWFARQNAGRR